MTEIPEDIWLSPLPEGRSHFRRHEIISHLGLKKDLISKYILRFPELRPLKRTGHDHNWGWYTRETMKRWALVKYLRFERKMNLDAIEIYLKDNPRPKTAAESPVREFVY